MKQIIGFDGYTVDGFSIIGKYGKPLKVGKNDVITLCVGTKRFRFPICKIIYAAQHDIDVRKINKGYSFKQDNGVIVCETFSNRMRAARTKYNNIIKVTYNDLDYIEQYAKLGKDIIKGVPDAKMQMFTLLNSKRNEFISYAKKASGGVGEQTAILYADQSIFKVFEAILRRTQFVCSPVASIKWHINKLIKDSRKKVNFDDGIIKNLD